MRHSLSLAASATALAGTLIFACSDSSEPSASPATLNQTAQTPTVTPRAEF